MNQDPIQIRLRQWFSRDTNPRSVRKISQLPIAVSTDIGDVRLENQDRACVLKAQVNSQKSFTVAVLCDGMGGMTDGAGCASLCISSFLASCISNRSLEPRERLRIAANEANKMVNEEYNERGGSTLSAFLIDSDGNFTAVNIGDSRIYALINSKLVQLSEDDTLAGQFSKSNDLHHMSHELLQYIGMGKGLEPHVIDLPNLNDISSFFMTTDGVHFVSKVTIEAIVRGSTEPGIIAKRLVEVSQWCGGKDNSTVVVANDLSSLLTKNNDKQLTSGSIEIWDSFGDVQLLGIEKEPMHKATLTESSNEVKTIDDSEIKTIDDERIVRASSLKRKAPRRKKKAPKKPKLEKKPQIKIDFK